MDRALMAQRRPAADVASEGDQRGRRDARDPGRLAQGRRPVGCELLPDFVGQAADRAIVEIGRQLQGLVPAVGGDVLPLAGKVAVVAGVDGQLLGDIRPRWREFRPKADEPVPADIGIGQQLQRRPGDAVLVDGDAVLGQGRRAEPSAPASLARPSASACCFT